MTHNNEYMPKLLEFLRLLAENNNREWFHEHKPQFDELRALWIADIGRLIGLMSEYDESLRGVDVKDCVYRIYRDIRFSPNKLPYKNHFGAVLGVIAALILVIFFWEPIVKLGRLIAAKLKRSGIAHRRSKGGAA